MDGTGVRSQAREAQRRTREERTTSERSTPEQTPDVMRAVDRIRAEVGVRCPTESAG